MLSKYLTIVLNGVTFQQCPVSFTIVQTKKECTFNSLLWIIVPSKETHKTAFFVSLTLVRWRYSHNLPWRTADEVDGTGELDESEYGALGHAFRTPYDGALESHGVVRHGLDNLFLETPWFVVSSGQHFAYPLISSSTKHSEEAHQSYIQQEPYILDIVVLY